MTTTMKGTTTMAERTTTNKTAQETQQNPATNKPGPADGSVEESRKYRRRAQKAEAERDELAKQLETANAQLDQARRSILQARIKSHGMIHPEDFETFTGSEPHDYFTDDGQPNDTRIEQALTSLKSGRPELFKRPVLPPANPRADPCGPKESRGTGRQRSPLALALDAE